ncbi:MAG: MaoC/PaaZ C-terminal domain-containing protein [Thermodesulfobacteriota bacterium]|nr:MaoC/PaaZ C-terminal domain-containing protein [Thermodesulfobacteriota bacterium]
MSGKLFDEWVLGEEFVTPSRTMTETDVVMFAAMSGDYNELHTSEAFMKNSQFGRRIVHGLLGLAVSHGLLFRTGFLEGTAIAFLGIESWKFEAPLFFGETIHVKAKVAEKIPSKSKPDRGVIKLFLQVIKDDGTVIQSGYKTLMIKRKPS